MTFAQNRLQLVFLGVAFLRLFCCFVRFKFSREHEPKTENEASSNIKEILKRFFSSHDVLFPKFLPQNELDSIRI